MNPRRTLGLRCLAGALCAAVAVACNGTTGDELVTFTAYAAGAPHAGDPFTVSVPATDGSATTYTVQIKSATMHIGALYLNQNQQDDESCISPGLYSDQVLGAIDVDLLSTTPQEFSLSGNGTADQSQSFTLWLTDGSSTLPTSLTPPSDTINSDNADPVVLLQATVTNQATGAEFALASVVSINQANRGTTPSDPAYPGENPICLQRIVSVPQILTVYPGQSVLLTIDPRTWFETTPLDFTELATITPPPATNDCQNDVCTPILSGACLGDPRLETPSFPDVGITPTMCIPNTNDTTSTNGAPIGQQFLTSIQAGNPATYVLSILASP